jgi:hypothetical protein
VLSSLVLACLLLTAAAAWRSPEYDEAYSIFLTAGDARPIWPSGMFTAGEVRDHYRGAASLGRIAADLRRGDVHPPLYFWALELWRRAFGPGWFTARLLSVVISVIALAALGWVASLAEIPPARAMVFALLCYGFAYTGIVARGFALAQALNLLGVGLVLASTQVRAGARLRGFMGGLALGAAGFSNYLAVFVALASFCWLCARRRRHVLPFVLLGFGLFLPAMLFFYLPQRASRTGQFQAFSLPHALALLAKDFGAAWFGGLPLYAGRAGPYVAAALGLISVLSAFFILRGWTGRSSLFAMAVIFPPLGMLTLGLLFNNTPIEIRYLAFTLPFLALLLAQSCPPPLRAVLITLEGCGVAGLILAPLTMQPQALAAHAAARFSPPALVLLPFGNDGVGVPGPFIAAAPDGMRLLLVKPGSPPDLSHEKEVILVSLKADQASTQVDAELRQIFLATPCWDRQQITPSLMLFTRSCGRP